jgi:acyl-CoA thioester hydrolase
MVTELGKPVEEWNAEGFNFVVYKMSITFHKAAKLNDRLRVVTQRIPNRSSYRFVLDQRIYRGDDLLTEAEVLLLCLDREMKLRQMPELG